MELEFELAAAPAETIAPFYKQTGDKWVLNVVGAVPQAQLTALDAKVTEFRTNNIALKKQVEDITKATAGVTGDVDKLVEARVTEMKSNFESQISTLTADKITLSTNLERVVLSDSVKTAATEYGVLPSALPDVLARAKEMFVVENGNAVPKDKKVDKDGKVYTISTWITSLTESAGHLFAQSRGSGSFKPTKGTSITGTKSASDKISSGLASRSK